MEWFVWIILFLIMAGCVFVVHYWVNLLNEKDSYHREELIDFVTILRGELQALSPDGGSGYLAAAAGVGLAILLTQLGGIFSPDTGPESDWTASEMPNYFFQSAISVLFFHLAWPSIRTIVEDSSLSSFLMLLFDHEDAFFWGMSVALAAFNLTSWGVAHQMSFLYVLINGLLLLVYAGYRLNLNRARLPGSVYGNDGLEYDDSESGSTGKKDEVEF
jgi:hypothetical protein